MDFKSFKLVQTDMTAQHRVYEGYKTENGVHLEYYISTEMWDDKTSGNVECRDTIRKIDGDEKLFQMLSRSRIRIALRSEMSLFGYHTQTRTNPLPTALPP